MHMQCLLSSFLPKGIINFSDQLLFPKYSIKNERYFKHYWSYSNSYHFYLCKYSATIFKQTWPPSISNDRINHSFVRQNAKMAHMGGNTLLSKPANTSVKGGICIWEYTQPRYALDYCTCTCRDVCKTERGSLKA